LCPRCNETKPPQAFARRGPQKQYLQSWCKKCQVARKKWRYANDSAFRQKHNVRSGALQRKKRLAGDVAIQARMLIAQAKYRAKRAGLPFDLQLNDVLPHLSGRCPVFGTPFEMRCGKDDAYKPTAPTLDQFVPRAGYTRENVRVISFRANVLKRDATAAELQSILDWMRREQIH
jgi:hypothetical protein